MPSDRVLGTVLRSLQTYTNQQDTPRLLGTASSLLTTLHNQLNVTLLSSQLLTAPAIWQNHDGLQTCMRCLSVVHSAAQAHVRHETSLRNRLTDKQLGHFEPEIGLSKDDWIRAVIKGADEQSPRWRHLLLLGGLLLGFGGVEKDDLSQSMRAAIEGALVTATNAALRELPENDELGEECITFVLNNCFPIMSDNERSRLDYDRLLPVLMRSTFHSSEGLRSAYFLGGIDIDVKPISSTQFQWSERSSSFQQLQSMLSSPLLSRLGPLSRLIGHSVERVTQSWLVTAALDDLEAFSRTLHVQWRQNKLSEIDSSEESTYLDAETLGRTTPALWKLQRSILYAIVIVLRSAVGRLLGDSALAADEVAPSVAAKTVYTLRHLYFITTRTGSTTFSEYTFANLTALDLLTTYPAQAEEVLRSIKPVEMGQVPLHPLDRCLDLFFLNTAEHVTLVLSPHITDELLVAAAAPYLAAGGNNHLLPIFEAAHSVMLAVFSAPQNADLTIRHLPCYIEALFKVFPSNLSARQFRMAFTTLMRLTTPPSVLFPSQPMLPATLLELLHERAMHAPTVPLFPQADSPTKDDPQAVLELSEQAILVLTTLDSLPQLHPELLEEWLPISASMINSIDEDIMRDHCRAHFWRMLVNGEMDPDRSSLCHAWWSTGGGRETVFCGPSTASDEGAQMSGALPDVSDSKL